MKLQRSKEMQQSKTRYFIDVETNIGLRNMKAGYIPEAVSIGIAKSVEPRPPEICYYKEFRPLVYVDNEAYAVHGLSQIYLMKKSQFGEADADEINDILRGSFSCHAHNASFDFKVLDREFTHAFKVFLPFQNLQCTQRMA